MTKFIAAIFAGSLLFASSPAFAMDSMHNSMMMMMPKCATGDPIVGVNMRTKMYMTHEQMKMKMAGMSDAKVKQMMMQNHMKIMCKSKADMMGAKMMPPKI
ncbi:MAG: hypothetical protein M3R51_09315 [Candidatus Eremiobacteraeota bacterium]|nr:hypothetical protein [Candidatus Eremiobacteraeota bacterium]